MENSCLKNYCENLRSQHPDFITLEQLRIICRIAKRTASYLVTNGVIPAIDTGKKTWRYRIAVTDIVTYLQNFDTVEHVTPAGTVCSIYVKPRILRKAYGEVISELPEYELIDRFDQAYVDYPDVLTTDEAAEIFGLGQDTILRHIKTGVIKAFRINGKYMIPKKYAIEFITTQEFIYSTSSTEFIPRLLHSAELRIEERSDYREE